MTSGCSTFTSTVIPNDYDQLCVVDSFQSGDFMIFIKKITIYHRTYLFAELCHGMDKWVNFGNMTIIEWLPQNKKTKINLTNDVLIKLIKDECLGNNYDSVFIRKPIEGQNDPKIKVMVPKVFESKDQNYEITFEITDSFETGEIDLHTWQFVPIQKLQKEKV